MRRAVAFVFLSWCAFALTGCASLKEGVRRFLALSTADIEASRGEAIVKVVDYGYEDCYGKVEKALTEAGSYIYAKRKDLIAVYVSWTDTTPAGVFFKKIDEQKTQLEIASPAKDTKEYLADKIFSVFSIRIKD